MRTRPTVRLLILDEQQRVLLFKYEDAVAIDPNQPNLRIYWGTPGGGIESGETIEEAGLRELWEETGISVTGLGHCVWKRERVIQFPDETVLFDELYYLVQVPLTDVSTVNLLPHELNIYRAHRWWSAAEIEQSKEIFQPLGFAQLFHELLNGTLPEAPLLLTS